jgi:outer membrane lipoprotein-sorting protein
MRSARTWLVVTGVIASLAPGLGPGPGAAVALAQTPSPAELLRKIDETQTAGSKITVWEMTIRGRRGSRTVKAKSWIEGVDRAFTEYLDPPREAGTKMLKIGGQLWTYAPSADRTIQVAGHMLRQSVMGSDMSYEDLMEDPKLERLYEAKVTGEQAVLERPCWVIELTARSGIDPAYHARKLWVDRERFLVLKEERFATSGRLLKTTEVTSVARMAGRWVAERAVFRDALKNDGGTDFLVTSVEFDPRIPDSVFSQASLRK